MPEVLKPKKKATVRKPWTSISGGKSFGCRDAAKLVDRGVWSVPKYMVCAQTLHSVDPQLNIDNCSVVVCA